jgi:DNA segregation ATPase FtsK/SpoIIIE, S-DNA-T family
LRLEECQPPWRFRLWQWGDYFGEKKEVTYQNLIQSLKRAYQQKLRLQVEKRAERAAGDNTRNETKTTRVPKQQFRKESLLPQKFLLPQRHEPDERFPSLNILLADQNMRPDERIINQTAAMIERTLHDFGISVIVIGFRSGPTVTQFAVQPGFKRKGNISIEDESQQLAALGAKIVSLQKDLELALSTERLRIEVPVPGKPYIGIEVPNPRRMIVRIRSILETDIFRKMGAPLAIALGRDISGQPVIADFLRMPNLLIAGTTGSGKSVCITAIAVCLAMNSLPEDLRMVMIDSRMVELSRFNGLPHLYGKVETNIERIIGVLRWLSLEMEHRYRLFQAANVDDIDAYNRRVAGTSQISHIPRIVVLIDELADLMMTAPNATEQNLSNLSQRAHITGIHLIVTTQRPSTDVVTSLIKANFSARLAFTVASGMDSRVILNTAGAESLLGRGDALFLNPRLSTPLRMQSVMVTDTEIEHLVTHWQEVVGVSTDAPPWEKLLLGPEKSQDEVLIEKAVSIVRQSQRASASMLQRRLRIGYPRAARLIDQLEEMGVVGPSQGGGKERDVLLGPIKTE